MRTWAYYAYLDIVAVYVYHNVVRERVCLVCKQDPAAGIPLLAMAPANPSPGENTLGAWDAESAIGGAKVYLVGSDPFLQELGFTLHEAAHEAALLVSGCHTPVRAHSSLQPIRQFKSPDISSIWLAYGASSCVHLYLLVDTISPIHHHASPTLLFDALVTFG